MKKIQLSIIASAIITSSLYANINETHITVSSATKSQQSIKDITSNVEVITSQELEAKNIVTLKDALTLISGIDYTSNGGLGKPTTINLRGMGSNRLLVLIDGIQFQDPSSTSGASIQHIMINDIDRIEVIKGAQSGIWGANAAAGVINIITKESKDGFHANLNLEIGSFKTRKLNLGVEYKTKLSDLKVNLTKIKSDGFTTKVPNKDDISKYEDDTYENTTINYQLGFKVSDTTKISIKHKNIDGISQYDNSDANDDNMKSDFNTKLTNITSTTNLKNHKIVASYAYSKFSRDEIGTVGNQWGEKVKIFNGTINNTELKDTYKYNDNSFLLVGISKKDTAVNYINTADVVNSDDFSSKAIFLTNSNKVNGSISGQTIFTQSLRYDKYNEFENKLTGKVGIKHFHDLLKGFTTSFNYGTAYNTPNIIQVLNPWGIANHNLEAEDIKTLDVSLNYKNINFTYFINKIDNMIAWENGGFNNITGVSKIKGYEISYKKAIGKSFITLNYTNLNAKDKDGNKLKKQASKTLKLGFDYFGIKKLHLNLNATYIGSRMEGVYLSDDVQTGKYTVTNFNANYKVNKDVIVYTKINNITNKYYQTTNGYATSPRAYYAGIKIKF